MHAAQGHRQVTCHLINNYSVPSCRHGNVGRRLDARGPRCLPRPTRPNASCSAHSLVSCSSSKRQIRTPCQPEAPGHQGEGLAGPEMPVCVCNFRSQRSPPADLTEDKEAARGKLALLYATADHCTKTGCLINTELAVFRGSCLLVYLSPCICVHVYIYSVYKKT